MCPALVVLVMAMPSQEPAQSSQQVCGTIAALQCDSSDPILMTLLSSNRSSPLQMSHPGHNHPGKEAIRLLLSPPYLLCLHYHSIQSSAIRPVWHSSKLTANV